MDKVYCADVWYATAGEQRTIALAKGKKAEDIHTQGSGAEGWESLLMSYRGKPGRLGLVSGLYVLAQDKPTLGKVLIELRKRKITPYDLETGEEDAFKLYDDAMGKIMGSKAFKRDKKHQRRVSKKGGHGKFKKYQEKRDGIAAEWLLQNIARAEWMTWERKAELLTQPKAKRPEISESVLRRRYWR